MSETDDRQSGGSGAGSTVETIREQHQRRHAGGHREGRNCWVGSLLSEVDRLQTALEAARKRIADLEAGGRTMSAWADEMNKDLAQSRATEAELRAIAEAGVRLHMAKYLPWHDAGGPNECSHGYAEGIPCPRCDGETLMRFVEAELSLKNQLIALDAEEPPAAGGETSRDAAKRAV